MREVKVRMLRMIGYKDSNSATVTEKARQEAQRPVKLDLRLYFTTILLGNCP